MITFKTFKQYIRRLQGCWASDNVYFSQMRDTYSAAYLPKYPEKSEEDTHIEFNGSMYQFRTANGAVIEFFDTYAGLRRYVFESYARFAALEIIGKNIKIKNNETLKSAMSIFLMSKYYKICCEHGFEEMRKVVQHDIKVMQTKRDDI